MQDAVVYKQLNLASSGITECRLVHLPGYWVSWMQRISSTCWKAD